MFTSGISVHEKIQSLTKLNDMFDALGLKTEKVPATDEKIVIKKRGKK